MPHSFDLAQTAPVLSRDERSHGVLDRRRRPDRVIKVCNDRPLGALNYRASGTLRTQRVRGRPRARLVWHTVNDAVLAYGEARLGDPGAALTLVEALGLDEVASIARPPTTASSSPPPSWTREPRNYWTPCPVAAAKSPPRDSSVKDPRGQPPSPLRYAKAMNNLIKRVKRATFGSRSFRNYRVRALLDAGKPNWSLLATVTPR